jgi:hypothetical protein
MRLDFVRHGPKQRAGASADESMPLFQVAK